VKLGCGMDPGVSPGVWMNGRIRFHGLGLWYAPGEFVSSTFMSIYGRYGKYTVGEFWMYYDPIIFR
jgi:hypothetical protein